jgi:hypothetical protein
LFEKDERQAAVFLNDLDVAFKKLHLIAFFKDSALK